MTSDEIQSWINVNCGHTIWKVEHSIGSHIFFRAGPIIENTAHFKKGFVYLRLELCRWRLYHKGRLILTSEFESNARCDRVISHLVGLRWKKIRIAYPDYLILYFQKNYIFYVREAPYWYGENEEMICGAIGGLHWSYTAGNGFLLEYDKPKSEVDRICKEAEMCLLPKE